MKMIKYNKLKNFRLKSGILHFKKTIDLMINRHVLLSSGFSKKNIDRLALERFNFSTPDPRISIAPTYKCNSNCPYCYAKGLEKLFPEDMAVEDFSKMIKWLKKQGKKNICFTGGEPTTHPKFKDLLRICETEGIKVGIYTNNLFSPKIREMLTCNKAIEFIMVHYKNPEEYTKKEYKLFRTNLDKIHSSGIYTFLWYNFPLENKSFKDVIKLAKKYKITIRFAFPAPGFSETKHFSFEDLKKVKDLLFRFIEECKQNNVFAHFGRPIPRCIFNNKEWKYLKKIAIARSRCWVGYKNDYTFRSIVNHDLSVFACFGLCNEKGPNILSFENFKEMNSFCKEKFKNLRLIPTAKECGSCKYRLNGECQGGCLSYKPGFRKLSHLV